MKKKSHDLFSNQGELVLNYFNLQTNFKKTFKRREKSIKCKIKIGYLDSNVIKTHNFPFKIK